MFNVDCGSFMFQFMKTDFEVRKDTVLLKFLHQTRKGGQWLSDEKQEIIHIYCDFMFPMRDAESGNFLVSPNMSFERFQCESENKRGQRPTPAPIEDSEAKNTLCCTKRSTCTFSKLTCTMLH